ncbi:MAG: hypothetical protein AMJ95_11055 [Omnitrophica WOR_2 bacterium SM23_72]|nr:MAG: hypothetical protein AMJ95_11055 [Omnitrophica WOR_2 bacterium SM23_72]
MEENVKSRLILILGILAVIFFISTVSSCGNAYRNKMVQVKETLQRKALEEKLNLLSQEKADQEETLASLQKQLDEERANHETTQKALIQEQLVNQSLKEELAKLTKRKEALE